MGATTERELTGFFDYGELLVNLNTWPNEYLVQFLKQLEVVLFDCDGVIWSGTQSFPKAQELVQKLRSLGKRLFFVTNDSTRTREDLLAKFINFGFEVYLGEILCPSYLAALYLHERSFRGKAYVIGLEAMVADLQSFGIESLPIGTDPILDGLEAWKRERQNLHKDPEVGAVIVGYDIHFNYKKLSKATGYLMDPNVLFLATNTDEAFPYGAQNYPDTGAILSAVKTAAGREPIVVGKPGGMIFEHLQKLFNVDPSKSLMIGDKASTDIQFGRNSNCWTLLVLSGITKLDEVRQFAQTGAEENKAHIPHFYLSDISEFYKLLCQTLSN